MFDYTYKPTLSPNEKFSVASAVTVKGHGLYTARVADLKMLAKLKLTRAELITGMMSVYEGATGFDVTRTYLERFPNSTLEIMYADTHRPGDADNLRSYRDRLAKEKAKAKARKHKTKPVKKRNPSTGRISVRKLVNQALK